MRLVFVVVVIFCAYLTGDRIAHPFIDGDLFWQRFLGDFVLTHHVLPLALGTDTFTAVGAPWVPQEWLLGILAALALDNHAMWALSVLAGVALCTTLLIVAWRSKRAGGSLYSTLAAMLFAGIVLESSFALRAQVLAWPLLAALLLALDEDGLVPLLAIPLTIVWANLHASALLAVPVVWIDAAAYVWLRSRRIREVQDSSVTIRRKKREKAAIAEPAPFLADRGVRTRLLLCVLVPLATLCTPLGVHLPLYTIGLLNSPIKGYINEWQHLRWSTQTVVGVLPLLILSLYGAPRLWRSRPRDVVLSLVFAVWGILAARNIALFAIVAALPVSLVVGAGEGWEDPLDRRPLGLLAPICAIALAPVVAWIAIRANPMFVPWPSPEKSIAALKEMPGDHRLLCAEYSWCAMALGAPNVRVFLDGRADPYPPQVWYAYESVAELHTNWQQPLQQYGVNALIAWHGGRLEHAMQTLPDWRQLPQDDPCCTLFVKKS